MTMINEKLNISFTRLSSCNRQFIYHQSMPPHNNNIPGDFLDDRIVKKQIHIWVQDKFYYKFVIVYRFNFQLE